MTTTAVANTPTIPLLRVKRLKGHIVPIAAKNAGKNSPIHSFYCGLLGFQKEESDTSDIATYSKGDYRIIFGNNIPKKKSGFIFSIGDNPTKEKIEKYIDSLVNNNRGYVAEKVELPEFGLRGVEVGGSQFFFESTNYKGTSSSGSFYPHHLAPGCLTINDANQIAKFAEHALGATVAKEKFYEILVDPQIPADVGGLNLEVQSIEGAEDSKSILVNTISLQTPNIELLREINKQYDLYKGLQERSISNPFTHVAAGVGNLNTFFQICQGINGASSDKLIEAVTVANHSLSLTQVAERDKEIETLSAKFKKLPFKELYSREKEINKLFKAFADQGITLTISEDGAWRLQVFQSIPIGNNESHLAEVVIDGGKSTGTTANPLFLRPGGSNALQTIKNN